MIAAIIIMSFFLINKICINTVFKKIFENIVVKLICLIFNNILLLSLFSAFQYESIYVIIQLFLFLNGLTILFLLVSFYMEISELTESDIIIYIKDITNFFFVYSLFFLFFVFLLYQINIFKDLTVLITLTLSIDNFSLCCFFFEKQHKNKQLLGIHTHHVYLGASLVVQFIIIINVFKIFNIG